MTPFDKPALRTKIYVGTDMIGGGKIDFLRRLSAHGSLSGAAAEMGITERRAEFFLSTLQACLADPITSGTGDARQLTALGEELIAAFEAHVEAVNQAAEPFLAWVEARQPPKG